MYGSVRLPAAPAPLVSVKTPLDDLESNPLKVAESDARIVTVPPFPSIVLALTRPPLFKTIRPHIDIDRTRSSGALAFGQTRCKNLAAVLNHKLVRVEGDTFATSDPDRAATSGAVG